MKLFGERRHAIPCLIGTEYIPRIGDCKHCLFYTENKEIKKYADFVYDKTELLKEQDKIKKDTAVTITTPVCRISRITGNNSSQLTLEIH